MTTPLDIDAVVADHKLFKEQLKANEDRWQKQDAWNKIVDQRLGIPSTPVVGPGMSPPPTWSGNPWTTPPTPMPWANKLW